MRFIAVLGVLFVLASCSDSDMFDLEYNCVIDEINQSKLVLSLEADLSMIKVTDYSSFYFYPYYESPDDIYFKSYPPEYLNSEYETMGIVFNKSQESITVRETSLSQEWFDVGCKRIK